ncbi:MAG: signal peptidase II [Metamycoplasmataceae bacterium]
MIKKYYSSFITYSKRHFEDNKKMILINFSFFLGLILILILIDQLTKTFLFTWADGVDSEGKRQGDGIIKNDFGLFGIKSVANYGVTVFGGLFPTWVLHVFSILIFIVCGFFALYSHDKLLIFAIAFTFSGTFGNFLDRAMFDGAVKDILFIPWLQSVNFFNGVFNFADIWLFVGSVIAISYIILLSIRHYKHNKF